MIQSLVEESYDDGYVAGYTDALARIKHLYLGVEVKVEGTNICIMQVNTNGTAVVIASATLERGQYAQVVNLV